MVKIEDFIDDLKKYLKDSITTIDNNFSALTVNDAYENENKPTPPEIKVMVFDFSEDVTSNSYDSENITEISCNIYAYASAMKFDGDTSKTNAVISTTKLASDIANVLNKEVFAKSNTNIISSTRRAYTGAMAVKDTSCYESVYVYEFKVLNN